MPFYDRASFQKKKMNKPHKAPLIKPQTTRETYANDRVTQALLMSISLKGVRSLFGIMKTAWWDFHWRYLCEYRAEISSIHQQEKRSPTPL